MGALMNSKNFLKLIPDDLGRVSILGVPIITFGGDRIKIKDNVYDLAPEIYKALPLTSYTGKTLKKEKDNIIL